jgi:hypothetical protein
VGAAGSDAVSSLSDALDALPLVPKRGCAFGEWLGGLPPEDAAGVRRAIASKKSARLLAEVITKHGYSVSSSTINNHRNGMCRSCQT